MMLISVGVTDQNVIHVLLNVKNIHALRQTFFIEPLCFVVICIIVLPVTPACTVE
jgi:hypothetical protein